MTAAAIALTAGTTFAATLEAKDGGTNSQGSIVGTLSSQVTGNGDWVGGNSTSGQDKTTGPHTRSDAVHAVQGSTPGAPGNSGNSQGNSHR